MNMNNNIKNNFVSETQISDFIKSFTIETTPFSADKIDNFRNILKPHTTIYVTFLPNSDYNDTIRTSKRLKEENFNPVPHFAARSIPSRAFLEEALNKLSGETGVNEVLCIAGAIDKPLGEFSSSMELIGSGLFDKFDIKRIGVAGHPEGSPDISDENIDRALFWKNHYNTLTDANLHIVTQFCFDPDVIINWDQKLQAAGITLPITVGVPGVASLKTLLSYAKACGVGPSIDFLRKQAKNITKLLVTSSPDNQVFSLTNYHQSNPSSGIKGIHIYPLGGLKMSAEWAYAIASGNFDLNDRNKSFQLR